MFTCFFFLGQSMNYKIHCQTLQMETVIVACNTFIFMKTICSRRYSNQIALLNCKYTVYLSLYPQTCRCIKLIMILCKKKKKNGIDTFKTLSYT